jgi:hypothetical protein
LVRTGADPGARHAAESALFELIDKTLHAAITQPERDITLQGVDTASVDTTHFIFV